MDEKDKILITELVKLLRGGGAHIGLNSALDKLPEKLRGVKPDNLPYSIWQLVEHIRIAQWDMLQFCVDDKHISPKWPDEYWPKEAAPASNAAWEKSIAQIKSDLDEFIELVQTADIYKKLPHGSGQSILREAFQVADHTAYHISEIIVIRRLLDDYPPKGK